MPTRKIDVGAMLRSVKNSTRNPRAIAVIAVAAALFLGATVVSRATQDARTRRNRSPRQRQGPLVVAAVR